MTYDPAFTSPGRFFKGNIHTTHSTRSDGVRAPEDVCETYREAGYDETPTRLRHRHEF